MPKPTTMISKDQLSGQKKKSKGTGKCNTKGVWVNSSNLSPCEPTAKDAIHFDSYLELRVYKKLIALFNINGVERQKPCWVCHSADTGITLKWCPDFYIPSVNVYVEAKGDWINSPSNKVDKTLFTWQFTAVTEITGCSVIVVSDQAFSIGKIEVTDFNTIESRLF